MNQKIKRKGEIKLSENKQIKEENENNELKEENSKELIIKENNQEIDREKLEKIEKEIKKQTTISEEKKLKINKKIFNNIVIAIVLV